MGAFSGRFWLKTCRFRANLEGAPEGRNPRSPAGGTLVRGDHVLQ